MHNDGHWLDRERLTVYPRIFIALYLLMGAAWVLMSQHGVDPRGKPLGYDFITFWGASYYGLQGRPELAYDVYAIFEAEKAAVPALKTVYAWYYPPTFFLLVLPLSLLPYLAAYALFIGASFSAYLAVVRRIAPVAGATALVLAFPGVFVNAFHGQNAFLTAAIAGAALLCLDRKPLMAGVLIGLLAIKPHLALLFPVALLCARAWKTIAAAAVTTLAFCALSVAVIGVQTLEPFLGSLDFARSVLERGVLPWPKMPTVFAFVSLLNGGPKLAYALHAMVALLAVVAMVRVWLRPQPLALRASALVAATFLVSPYIFDYDLAWLALPLGFLAVDGIRRGWLHGEREVLLAAWLLPIFGPAIATAISLQVGPMVSLGLLGLVLRRMRQADRLGPADASV